MRCNASCAWDEKTRSMPSAKSHRCPCRALAPAPLAAQSYFNDNHNGFLIAGEFKRGDHRGGGKWSMPSQRDRVRALQLMQQAMALLAAEPNRKDVAEFYWRLSRWSYGDGQHSWKLQALTDLTTLPDYEEG